MPQRPQALKTAQATTSDAVSEPPRVSVLLADMAALSEELAAVEARLETACAERDQALAAQVKAEAQISDAETRAAELEDLRAKLAELRKSRSWRFTAPLRAVARYFRSGKVLPDSARPPRG